MKGLAPLFLGIFGTFAFSWIGLTVVPNWQIGHLNPQADEEGTDISDALQLTGSDAPPEGWEIVPNFDAKCLVAYLMSLNQSHPLNEVRSVAGSPAAKQAPNPSPAAQVGSPAPAASHAAPGGSPAASPSSPAPKAPAAPAPKAPLSSPSPSAITNASPAASPSPAAGAPWPVQTAGEPPMYSAAWHHVHLYSPRSINVDSNMPSYRFLYEKRRIRDARSADGRAAAHRFRRATRRLGNCSQFRCEMSGRLLDVSQSIASAERSEISRRGASSARARGIATIAVACSCKMTTQ